MDSQAIHSDDKAAITARQRCTARVALVLVAALPAASTVFAAGPSQSPVSPQVQEQGVDDLAEENPVLPWKPGDPVRIVPDLRESGDASEFGATIEMLPPQPLKPIVLAPVTPGVMGQSVEDLPEIKPYRMGDPVRIVPDLKESGVED